MRSVSALALVSALAWLPLGAAAQKLPYESRTVSFPNGDLSLGGELYLPEGPGPFPTLVYNHGSAPGMSSRQAFEALGPVFAEHGWAFVAPYRRGQGLSADAGPYILDEIAAARASGAHDALPLIAGILIVALVVAVVATRKRKVWMRAAAVLAVLAIGPLTYSVAGNRAGATAMIELLEAEHLADHLAALSWLENQSFADLNRIATAGNSFGGIVTLLAAASTEYCAAVDASGAAQSWSQSTELRRRLGRAARRSLAPVLFFQAENDYSVEASRILSGEVQNSGFASERIIYPAFGDSAEDGHAFAWQGSEVWADDVFEFLGKHCSAELIVNQASFHVYSAFWPNLHHVLYSEAWRRRSDRERVLSALLPEPLPTAELTADEQSAWDAAVEYYQRGLSYRALQFGMNNIRRALVDSGASSVPPVRLDTRHREMLMAAAPVYREHWWPAHDAANRAWIAEAMPLIASVSPEVPERLASLYQTEWFERWLRIDVVRVANPQGAYTALDPEPAHITISSSEPNNAGLLAAEVVFHEASHALDSSVRRAIFSEANNQRKNTRDLWHAAMFYLTGEVLRQSLASRGIEYQPYLYSTDLFDRDYPDFRAPLETHWQAYIDGESSLSDAVRAMVASIEQPDDFGGAD